VPPTAQGAHDVVLAHAFTGRSDGLWRQYWVFGQDQDAEDAFWS
jgi:hypothetical protein